MLQLKMCQLGLSIDDGGDMGKRLLAILILVTTVLAGCGGERGSEGNAAKQGRTAGDVYKQLLEKRRVIDTMEERLAMTKAFLEEFPESQHTASAINAIFYYQGENLGDMTGAVSFAEEIRGGINDPEIAMAVDRELLGFYGKSSMTDKMLAIADRLAAIDALSFADYWNLIESTVSAEEWNRARVYCATARELANADAYRADNPDRDFSEGELADAINNRVGMLLVKDGWARANMGQLDEALADFARADRLVPRYYFGIPEYDLNLYWGKTLVMKGDHEAAIERLAIYGLVMRNEGALAGLKEAYLGMHGNERGFEEFASELHERVATPIDDFEMGDYVGKRHRFSDLRDDVTLLTLWFPT
jgi:tetratricopeptide (TPR) repeat protein